MYLISGKQGNIYTVLDTSDGAAENYTKEQIYAFIQQGLDIAGVTKDGGIYVLDTNLATLWYSEMGIPLKAKFPKDYFWKQLIFVDCFVAPNGKFVFRFFDSSGLFCYSSEFLLRSGVLINFYNNDPETVAMLIQQLKSMQ